MNIRLVKLLPNKIRLGVKGLDHIASMLALRRALQEWGPDIIHFQWLALPLVDRLFLPDLRRFAPLVLTVHDTNPFNGNPSSIIQRHGFFAGLSVFDKIIVHTEQGRARLLKAGVALEKLSVLPHGPLTKLPEFVPNPMTGEIVFLLFGKIKPYKGLDLLLTAFGALPQALREKARIRVVGKPYMDLKPFESQAERLGISSRVAIEPFFVGDAEVDSLFGSDTVAVFPYREIEASGVLSIALANGCPVIAASLGTFREIIQNGINGLLFDKGDVVALTSALERMIEDRIFCGELCSRCAQNG